ncbi:MAG TPA: NAD(P)-dependent oxidoreductase [Solirubrobacteraceae bacterium]|jgi:3-hydroxyisobutyrate dehydrogenase|nr:NAD(P)-dependent oxidoreductase [Solirubrobacteraceae bacterium]
MISQTAFIGLGRMGIPMTGRLAAAGVAVRGYDVSAQARAALDEVDGARAAASAAEAAQGAASVILMLPTSDAVEAVLLEDGLLEALEPPTILIDMGSSEPLRTRALAERAAQRGIEMLDAPVSGGVRGALEGTLTIMVGGAERAFGECRAMFDAMGGNVRHVGGPGAGHALKALNNLLSAVHLLASCEALAVAERFGLDPAVFVDVVSTSSGRSGSVDNKLPNYVIPARFDSGFTIGLMVKDMAIAVALGEELGLSPKLGESALDAWRHARSALSDDADHTEISRWVELAEARG